MKLSDQLEAVGRVATARGMYLCREALFPGATDNLWHMSFDLLDTLGRTTSVGASFERGRVKLWAHRGGKRHDVSGHRDIGAALDEALRGLG